MVRELTKQIEDLQRQLQQAASTPLRRRMAVTRASVTHKFAIGKDNEGYLTVGIHEDGRPGEVFIKMAKEGSTIGGLMDVIGILTSLALQHGVPLADLVTKLAHTRFEPSGPTGNPDVPIAKSPVDYIFRWLGQQFSKQSGKRPEVALAESLLPPYLP